MKNKKRELKININLSNRWFYFLITLGILAIVGVSVYAATYSPSGAGHPITEISTCGANQILKMNSAGTAWTCGNDTVGITDIPSGTLRGWCESYRPTFDCDAISPAYCTDSRTPVCACPSGYTSQELITNIGNYNYYSCLKN